MLYLDHAATTAVHPEVTKEMEPYMGEVYANPSGVYTFSEDTREMIEKVRQKAAESIRAYPDEIYFTSGGTEADNWALIGAAEGLYEKGKHIITSGIEHHAILRTCEYLEKRGFSVTYLPVDSSGKVLVDQIKEAIRPDTILISIMFANNEIGTIEPIQEIGTLAGQHNILFHTDAVQAYLHENIDVKAMKIDMLSVSSHKFQGPKGVGFLYVRRGVGLPSFMHGGGQERGRRAGTENVAGIVGMGKAIAIGMNQAKERHAHLCAMRDFLIEQIAQKIPYCRINGSQQNRLDNNVNVSFRYLEGESLIILLDLEGICVSGGSACSSSEKGVSHVLQEIGLSEEWARGTVRISLGVENTMEQMQYFVQRLSYLVEQLRQFSDEYLKLNKTDIP